MTIKIRVSVRYYLPMSASQDVWRIPHPYGARVAVSTVDSSTTHDVTC